MVNYALAEGMQSAGVRKDSIQPAHFHMNIRKLLLLSAAILGLTAQAVAQTTATEATVAKFNGTATITSANGSAIQLAVGAKVPQGATIETAAASEVYLQMHGTTVATVKANTKVVVDELSVTTTGGKVTKENTAITLRSGNLVSALDPNKKAVNSYQVRTPKGVAAARGTTFTVSYNGVDYTIVTTSGGIEITTNTGLVINVAGGQASVSNVSGGAATAVADLPAEAKAEAIEAMTVAVATVAVAADQGMLGDAGTAELRDAARTVIAAVPETASTIVALVEAAAPNQTQEIVDATRDVAPQQSGEVQRTLNEVQAGKADTPDQTPSQTPKSETQEDLPPTTTPQPLDVTVTSRSGE
jgi:hypothetical protein